LQTGKLERIQRQQSLKPTTAPHIESTMKYSKTRISTGVSDGIVDMLMNRSWAGEAGCSERSATSVMGSTLKSKHVQRR
jgi:hypothetical protein